MIEISHQEKKNLYNNRHPVYKNLKLELKNLENRFSELTGEKIEYETKINNFNSSYMLRLGGLIEEILKLRLDIFGKENKKDQIDFSINNQLFEDAQLDYEEFKKTFQQQLQDAPQFLDNSEKKQLKIAYRKASRLCHPDKLAEDAKAKGEESFKALNEAYRHQDLERVQGILLKLESETPFFISITKQKENRALMQEKIILLYEQIAILDAEIKCLKESEIYLRIQSITDLNNYFSELMKELQVELEILKGKNIVN